MSPEQITWLIIGGSLGIIVALITLAFRRSSAFHQRLLQLAGSFGWEGARRVWWSGAIRGRWRGLEVEIRHMGRYKGIPERLQLTVQSGSPARVILKRRTGGILSKPLTMFGPPLVEPMNFAARDEYWIRSDQPMFVETLLSRAPVAEALEPNLIAGFDFVDIESTRLRIMRAVDDRAVKKHFNRPFFQWGKDLELIDTIATEESKLASAIIEAIGASGHG
jgi:hypothetical protein